MIYGTLLFTQIEYYRLKTLNKKIIIVKMILFKYTQRNKNTYVPIFYICFRIIDTQYLKRL